MKKIKNVVYKKSFMYSLMNHIMNKKLRVSCICSFYHAKIHTETPHFTAKCKSRRMRLLLLILPGLLRSTRRLQWITVQGRAGLQKPLG